MTDQNITSAAEPTSDIRLSRRTLLRTAAGLAGGLVIGLVSAPAQAHQSTLSTAQEGIGKDAPLSMAFWNGSRLVDPAHLTADHSDWTLGAKITLNSRPAGEKPTIQVLTAYFPVQDGTAVQWTPFTAWGASPGDRGHGTSFLMPVHSTQGLRLSIEHGTGKLADCRLGRKNLRAGSYLFAPAGTDLHGCILRGGEHLTGHNGQPVSFDHLVLTVAPA